MVSVLVVINMTRNKYFELKKLVGLPLQLELLAVFIRKSGHNNMRKQCNHIQKV